MKVLPEEFMVDCQVRSERVFTSVGPLGHMSQETGGIVSVSDR